MLELYSLITEGARMNTVTEKAAEIGIGEAAYLLACTPNAVRHMAITGKLRHRFKHGTRERRFRLTDVLELREQRRLKPERRGRRLPLIDLLQNLHQTSNATAARESWPGAASEQSRRRDHRCRGPLQSNP
jgi:hypothetical protein